MCMSHSNSVAYAASLQAKTVNPNKGRLTHDVGLAMVMLDYGEFSCAVLCCNKSVILCRGLAAICDANIERGFNLPIFSSRSRLGSLFTAMLFIAT